MDARAKLKAATGEDREAAQALLAAIGSQMPELVGRYARELVRSGKYDLVMPLLIDQLDMTKREVAHALATEKSRRVATGFLSALADFDLTVRGDTQSDEARAITKKAFYDSLSEITGVRVQPEWSAAEVAEHLSPAVKRLPP